jgi:hypothetical protein
LESIVFFNADQAYFIHPRNYISARQTFPEFRAVLLTRLAALDAAEPPVWIGLHEIQPESIPTAHD